METNIEETKLKDILKDAIIEVLEERKEVVHHILVEVMEDIAMIQAIKEGEETATVERQEIFRILEEKV